MAEPHSAPTWVLPAGEIPADPVAARAHAVVVGTPAGGPGGTARAVVDARRRGIDVKVVWPAGAHRG